MRLLRLLFAVALLGAASAARAEDAYSFYRDSAVWTDERGEQITLGRWTGRPMVISMGYAACRRVCATTTLVFKEIQRQLDAKGVQAEFVLISFDEKAAPEDWELFRRRRGISRDNWHFLSGSADDTRRLARLIGVEYWYDGHMIQHDFRILVLDERGRRRADIDWDRRESEDIAALFAAAVPAR